MFSYVIFFLFGLVVGSFLNVCIYRIPRNRSIIWPSSRCPACNAPIRAVDNIPLISYILLRGRCRECSGPISARYPLVEGLNALFYVVLLWRYGLTAGTIVFMVFFSTLLVITFIDLDFQIIPDLITIPGTVIFLVLAIFIVIDPFSRQAPLGLRQSVSGLLLGFGLYYAIAVLSKGGMGGGDIKMMAMVGALTGWKGVLFTTFFGSLAGSIFGISLMLLKGRGRKSRIPFGPFLAFGAALYILAGREIVNFYLNFLG